MNWLDYSDILLATARRLEGAESLPGREEAEQTPAGDADSACKEFARSNKWPDMTAETKRLCCMRLGEAAAFCVMLERAPIPLIPLDQAKEWLLIEVSRWAASQRRE